MIILNYFLNSIVFIFVSWIVGLLLNNVIKNTDFYSKLTKLNFIKKESTYNAIGMDVFKWFVRKTFFKYFNQKLNLKTRPSILQLREVRTEMTYSEISHLIAFVFILGILIMKLWKGQFIYAIILLDLNIVFNLYPSLLQQQNKKRIDKLLKQ